jgi:predicted sulfurtransferase
MTGDAHENDSEYSICEACEEECFAGEMTECEHCLKSLCEHCYEAHDCEEQAALDEEEDEDDEDWTPDHDDEDDDDAE